MNKKKWALLIISCLVCMACFKLYYKKLQKNIVPASADYIAIIDVKRVINTILWQIISTPSKWKVGNVFSSKDTTTVDWKDMVEIPDYVQVFHSKNQPTNIWYTVLAIKDTADFNAGLKAYDFSTLANTEFENGVIGLHISVVDDFVLLSNAVLQDSTYHNAIKSELFKQKKYTSSQLIHNMLAAKSHVALGIAANTYLQSVPIFTANFTNDEIKIKGQILPKAIHQFSNEKITYCDSSLCTIAYSQALLNEICNSNIDAIQTISTALNVQADSFFLPTNKQYKIDVASFLPRIDSAISYTYDNNFNPTEKVITNQVIEPAYQFTALGNGITNMFTYLQKSKKLEVTNTGNLFTAVPFVKSYCTVNKNYNSLYITANNYKPTVANKYIDAIAFVQLWVNKIPESLIKYLPTDVAAFMANVKAIQIKMYKNANAITVEGTLYKKNINLPFYGDF